MPKVRRRTLRGPVVTASRIIDAEGDSWPVTGYECDMCHWPLAPHVEGQKYHPGCAPEDRGLDGTPRKVTL